MLPGEGDCCIHGLYERQDSYFVSRERFEPMERLLKMVLERRGCSAEIYLFMPDHVHLLLRGSSEESNPLEAMYEFKQRSGFWLKQHHAGARWQKDFYDHLLRWEEETGRRMPYILENPVRAGLCTDWKNYALKGSTV